VTVCIAARASDGSIFCVADRMVTAGDIEMESPVSKIFAMSNFLNVMPSDNDVALHTEILLETQTKILKIIEAKPTEWPLVKDMVDVYISTYDEKRQKLAERAFLTPLKLTHETFLEKMRLMDKKIVARLTEDILNFEMPAMSIIMAGRDPLGSHIYEVHNGDSGSFNTIGYAAIGAGARHANAHFMMSAQSGATSVAETLWNSYLAKKRAEVAPGVGRDATDIGMVGPQLGANMILDAGALKSQLEKVYKQTIEMEEAARKSASKEMVSYVEGLAQQAIAHTAPQAESAGEAPPPKSNGKSAA
jgi:hypothetical protein